MDVTALLAWYRAHRRSMPWRDEVSPYRTLVSEIMLQQTRVDTVIPYFQRFIGEFPTAEALAAAPLERVLERWSGLGYYSRARNLHAAAKAVAAEGGFPQDAEGLRGLPGVGPYTAGAIASIALGLDEALVDGNVERVICRQMAWAEDPKRIKARLWEQARAWLPKGEAGDFNQALMELGATICTPSAPSCLLCPVRAGCAGVDGPERYPAKAPKAAVPEAVAVAALLRDDGRVLLARRPATGLLAGLWELPGALGADLGAALTERVGLTLLDATPLGTVTHVFSHLRLHTTVYTAQAHGIAAAGGGYQEVRWVPAAEVDGMALSTLTRRTLALGSAPAAMPRKPRATRRPAPPS
ncbi:MAG: A/G-specific adenine glycosylase [Pseudomonadota bacterium]|nr:A/G-specific adenine glycosylase [Pseudomonadota bacterium]